MLAAALHSSGADSASALLRWAVGHVPRLGIGREENRPSDESGPDPLLRRQLVSCLRFQPW